MFYFSGGLADGEDARGQLHSELDARRHASEGERCHHEGVPFWPEVSRQLLGSICEEFVILFDLFRLFIRYHSKLVKIQRAAVLVK